MLAVHVLFYFILFFASYQPFMAVPFSFCYRIMSMQALTQLHTTLLTISVRWRLTIIQQILISWTTANIQVLRHWELLMHGLLFFKSVWSILVRFQSSSCAILFYTTDTDEQKRFVKTYLSISGKYEFNVWIDCLNLFARF